MKVRVKRMSRLTFIRGALPLPAIKREGLTYIISHKDAAVTSTRAGDVWESVSYLPPAYDTTKG